MRLGSDLLPNHAPVLFEAQLKKVREAEGTVMRRRLPLLPPAPPGEPHGWAPLAPGSDSDCATTVANPEDGNSTGHR